MAVFSTYDVLQLARASTQALVARWMDFAQDPQLQNCEDGHLAAMAPRGDALACLLFLERRDVLTALPTVVPPPDHYVLNRKSQAPLWAWSNARAMEELVDRGELALVADTFQHYPQLLYPSVFFCDKAMRYAYVHEAFENMQLFHNAELATHQIFDPWLRHWLGVRPGLIEHMQKPLDEDVANILPHYREQAGIIAKRRFLDKIATLLTTRRIEQELEGLGLWPTTIDARVDALSASWPKAQDLTLALGSQSDIFAITT